MKNIEIITWRDIHALKTQWRTLEESIEEGKILFNYKQFTVGVVIYEDKDMILIAASGDVDDKEKTYNDISMIPTSEIIKRDKLK